MDIVRLRKCTEKSRLGIGRYPDTEIGRLLNIEPNAVRYAYYHYEFIDFTDAVKNAADIRISIDKPGMDHDKYIENSRILISEMSDEERIKYLSHVRKRRKIEGKNRAVMDGFGRFLTKGQMQSINQGKML